MGLFSPATSYLPNGTWTYVQNSDGSVTGTVTGRVRRAWWKKLMPWWWLYNSDDPGPPAWYLPGSTALWRLLAWYLRNPLHNFDFYVIGVADRDYAMRTVFLSADRQTYQSVIRIGGLPLPFYCYVGKLWTVKVGWQMHGDFQVKINLNNQATQAY